jgi:hypothetical protein
MKKVMLTDWKALSVHERINFRFYYLNWRAYGVKTAFVLTLNEAYYGPCYHGSSPFPCAWSNDGCRNPLTFEG